MGVASLWEITTEIADTIRAVLAADATFVDCQVEPGLVLQPTPPTIDVYPADPSTGVESQAFGDVVGEDVIIVQARVAANDADANQQILAELMDWASAFSITSAVTDDETLNGLATSVHLVNQTGFMGIPTIDGMALYLGAQWTFSVIRANT